MTYNDLIETFKDRYSNLKIVDYRPVCHELFTDDKIGITIWLESGDVLEYYPKMEVEHDKARDN